MYVWLSVDRVILWFGLVCLFVHICVLFRFLFIIVLGCGSSAVNEDIVRFRCVGGGGGVTSPFYPSFCEFFQIFVRFRCVFVFVFFSFLGRVLCTIWIGF